MGDSKHGGGPHKVLLRCPQGPLLDQDRCEADTSFFGSDFTKNPVGTYYFIKHQDGRLFERSSTMFGKEVHKYYLRRLVDEHGQIDEDNFDILMEKLDGQDLIVSR